MPSSLGSRNLGCIGVWPCHRGMFRCIDRCLSVYVCMLCSLSRSRMYSVVGQIFCRKYVDNRNNSKIKQTKYRIYPWCRLNLHCSIFGISPLVLSITPLKIASSGSYLFHLQLQRVEEQDTWYSQDLHWRLCFYSPINSVRLRAREAASQSTSTLGIFMSSSRSLFVVSVLLFLHLLDLGSDYLEIYCPQIYWISCRYVPELPVVESWFSISYSVLTHTEPTLSSFATAWHQDFCWLCF